MRQHRPCCVLALCRRMSARLAAGLHAPVPLGSLSSRAPLFALASRAPCSCGPAARPRLAQDLLRASSHRVPHLMALANGDNPAAPEDHDCPRYPDSRPAAAPLRPGAWPRYPLTDSTPTQAGHIMPVQSVCTMACTRPRAAYDRMSPTMNSRVTSRTARSWQVPAAIVFGYRRFGSGRRRYPVQRQPSPCPAASAGARLARAEVLGYLREASTAERPTAARR